MKKYLVLFLFLSWGNSFCQHSGEKFQNKTWNSGGDILKSETFTVTTEPFDNTIESFEFLSDGNLLIMKEPDNVPVKFSYQFLNDKLKVYTTVTFKESNTKQEMVLYYKIRELNSNTFEFVPIRETEYK